MKFDIAIDRVEKIPVPLLVIGLGGTGCDALRTVKEVFAERYVLPQTSEGKDLPAPPKTAYLGIDSLSIRPNGLEVSEYVEISLSGMDKLLTNQAELLTPNERTWINSKLRHSTGGMGMGTIRQAARLALSRNYEKVRTALKGALNQIVSATLGDVPPNIKQYEIVIITGIGGGTGSGIFLDVAQIVRAVAKEASVLPAKLTGYIVMPDVSLEHVSAASGMEGPIKHNAYAALKELDFWMRVKEHETPYTMTYGSVAGGTPIEWKEPPFDNCILMSGCNVSGVPYKNPYSTVCKTIAENLMHYMAAEDGATEQYSYRQYEDNLSAIKVNKSYPLNYCYRAIGAFTKRIPKKPILYYEGTLLLKAFIPMRDSEGQLQPDRRNFTDGQGAIRALGIIGGKGGQLLQDFSTNVCKLPSICNIDLSDKVKVSAAQAMTPVPHSRWHKWRDEVSKPAALQASKQYLEQAWSRFCDFAATVFCDPEQGPFALEQYLDAKDGLLSYLNDTLNQWTTRYRNIHSQGIPQAEDMCATSWPAFRNPPLLGRKAALEQYDHAIRTLYSTVRESSFLESFTDALHKLILRIGEYEKDGLKPVCASLLNLEKEFATTETDDNAIASNIYSLDTVRASIDAAFSKANEEDKLSRRFLNDLMKISLRNQKSVDANTSGVEFTSRSTGLVEMCHLIQAVLEENYGSVNDQSLDDIMVANVGENEADQHKWMDALATDALGSALPMFQMDSVFAHEHAAPYSYMSIPQNAVKHVKYITEAFATHDPAVQPKASTLTDHMYCLMAYDKLPLYRYALMEDLRKQYDQDLVGENALGMHLVFNGDDRADFATNWSLLPSPKPFFLFPQGSYTPLNEQKDYEKVRTLVSRGIRCGMIRINSEETYPSAEITIQFVNHIAPSTSETMLQVAEEIQARRDPMTGETYAHSKQSVFLAEYLASGQVVTLRNGVVKPSNLAAVLHLDKEPCDPFDPSIQGDTTKIAKAKENHQKLCIVMIEALIYTQPALVRALDLQVDAFEKIHDFIEQNEAGQKIWEKRLDYAETAAEIFIYLSDNIFLGMDGYRYKLKGEKYSIIAPALLAEDLKKIESDLLKTIAFLADVNDEQAAKADLTDQLRIAKKNFEEQLENEELTADDMQSMIEAADDLSKEAEEVRTALEREARLNPNRVDELRPQAEMMQEVARVAGAAGRKFKKLAKGL